MAGNLSRLDLVPITRSKLLKQMGIGRSIRNDCLRPSSKFCIPFLLQSGQEEALIELRTSFDGYELLRSNDEVEETVSSQFISASVDRMWNKL